MHRPNRTVWPLLLLAALGCGDDGTGPQDPEDVTFGSNLEIDLAQMTRLPSGVYIETVAVGEGSQVAAAHEVTLNYETYLSSGAQVDYGQIQAQPLSRFIQGFIEGVTGMRPGEARKIVVPSELGYGDRAQGNIPANSVLVFHVTLISFE